MIGHSSRSSSIQKSKTTVLHLMINFHFLSLKNYFYILRKLHLVLNCKIYFWILHFFITCLSCFQNIHIFIVMYKFVWLLDRETERMTERRTDRQTNKQRIERYQSERIFASLSTIIKKQNGQYLLIGAKSYHSTGERSLILAIHFIWHQKKVSWWVGGWWIGCWVVGEKWL